VRQRKFLFNLRTTMPPNRTFAETIAATEVKYFKVQGIIKRNIIYLNSISFVLLYKSMVRSHLDYCSSVWHHIKMWYWSVRKSTKRARKLILEFKKYSIYRSSQNCQRCTVNKYKILGLSGKYYTAVTPRVIWGSTVTSRGKMILGWRKIRFVQIRYSLFSSGGC